MTGRLAQLVSDIFFYSAGLVLRRGISIVTLPVFTRHLSVQEFGVLSIISTVRELLSVVFEWGIPNSSARFYYDCRTEEERRRLFGTLFLFIMVTSFAGCLLLVLAGPAYWNRFVLDVPFHPYISLTIVTVFLLGMGILPRTLFRVTGRVPLYTTLGVGEGVLAAGLSIALVAIWNLGAMGPVLGNMGACFGFFFIFFAFLKSDIAWAFSPRSLYRSLAFGLPEIPVRMASWALKLADRLILQAYQPLSVVGLYSVGYLLGGTVFELIASSLNSAILPFFYRTATQESEEASRRIFADVAAYNAALLGFLGLGTILFAREFIVIFTTSMYQEAETVVPLVAWASIFQALAHIPNRAIYLAKKTTLLPVVFITPAALNVGLNILLIPRYGMVGAAWSTLAAYPVLFSLALVAAQRVCPIPYDYWRMAKPLMIALAFSLLKEVIPTDSLVIALSMKVLVLCAFPLALVASGFVTCQERAVFRTLAIGTMGRPAMLRKRVEEP